MLYRWKLTKKVSSFINGALWIVINCEGVAYYFVGTQVVIRVGSPYLKIMFVTNNLPYVDVTHLSINICSVKLQQGCIILVVATSNLIGTVQQPC